MIIIRTHHNKAVCFVVIDKNVKVLLFRVCGIDNQFVRLIPYSCIFNGQHFCITKIHSIKCKICYNTFWSVVMQIYYLPSKIKFSRSMRYLCVCMYVCICVVCMRVVLLYITKKYKFVFWDNVLSYKDKRCNYLNCVLSGCFLISVLFWVFFCGQDICGKIFFI